MAQTQNQQKLLKILNEIFQLDQSDLDFGIYRIMNTKSKEIREFLDNDLLLNVAKAFSTNDNSAIQKELNDKVKSFTDDGFTQEQIDNNTKVVALREQLTSTSGASNLENDVFSHLANFFKRYYKDGDFVSLRRYKKDTYAIPYEGEEVKLHWANSDQYYIKSGEYFRDYSFKTATHTVHFKLKDAQTTSNNNKSEKRVFIYQSHEEIDHELFIYFVYENGKEHLFPTDIELKKYTLDELKPTEKNKTRTLLEKHLVSYTSRNSFDYFIHKDLGGFLSRELDFYIKNEMLFLDDILESPIKYEEVMSKVKIFKTVSQKIIAFLTQIEELQKKLWEKKKFVIETNYCITLDKIPQKYHEEIFACETQLAEWQNLFGDEALASFFGEAKASSLDELKYLVLDTKFFDTKFKYSILSEFDNLDETCDGVLINSENFGALNLLQESYKEQVKTVYIDPPYNTGNDGFLYNDSFQHSSWMSFMYDRLALGRELMSDDGVIFSSIDDGEQHNLKILQDIIFGSNNFISNIIWEKRFTRSNNSKLFTTLTEPILLFRKSIKVSELKEPRNKKSDSIYSNPDNDSRGVWTSVSIVNPATKEQRPNLSYEIKNPFTDKIVTHPTNAWKIEKNKYLQYENDDRLYWGKEKTNIYPRLKKFLFEMEGGMVPVDLWKHQDTGTTDFGSKQLSELFDKKNFDFPKPTTLIERAFKIGGNPTCTILDFFAGSGTTGHAVINLNREDGGKRKYILVEMGEYFDTVTKPRIQKVIYSDSWKDGKPTTQNGISQMFKYFKLESYEDTLNNLEFTRTKAQEDTLNLFPHAKEDYLLNYSLHAEAQGSLLNIDTFSTPFDYKLKIATSSVGETQETTVDLVETFNYLLGLVVKRIELLKGYLVVDGANLKGEKILIIWRDGQSSEELDEFFKKMDRSVETREFDTIYVNGDNNLDNLRKEEEHFKVKLIEQEFKRLMFHE